jgi:hypothetical protein
VAALWTIYQLQLTPEQMKSLRKLAEKTGDPNVDREEAKASAKFTRAMQTLRAALLDGSDAAAIGKAEEQLAAIRDAEEPELDDGIAITSEARLRTPEVLRLLKAPQMASWIVHNEEAIVDPRDMLRSAITQVRTLQGEEFNNFRDDISEEAGRLLAGIQAKRAERIHDRVFGLLTRAHDLTDDEVATKQPELEKEIEEIIGRTSATDVIRHTVELAVAELLSNPRLIAALNAKLK